MESSQDKLQNYIQSRRFEDYIFSLVRDVYPNLQNRDIFVEWRYTGTNAVVLWNSDGSISIRCSRAIQHWPEEAIIGLLAHELSHISLEENIHSELIADKDVVARGLGVYLAVERFYSGVLFDMVMEDDRDRYLGYDSLRKQLVNDELQQLDEIISNLGLES